MHPDADAQRGVDALAGHRRSARPCAIGTEPAAASGPLPSIGRPRPSSTRPSRPWPTGAVQRPAQAADRRAGPQAVERAERHAAGGVAGGRDHLGQHAGVAVPPIRTRPPTGQSTPATSTDRPTTVRTAPTRSGAAAASAASQRAERGSGAARHAGPSVSPASARRGAVDGGRDAGVEEAVGELADGVPGAQRGVGDERDAAGQGDADARCSGGEVGRVQPDGVHAGVERQAQRPGEGGAGAAGVVGELGAEHRLREQDGALVERGGDVVEHGTTRRSAASAARRSTASAAATCASRAASAAACSAANASRWAARGLRGGTRAGRPARGPAGGPGLLVTRAWREPRLEHAADRRRPERRAPRRRRAACAAGRPARSVGDRGSRAGAAEVTGGLRHTRPRPRGG